MKTAASEGVIVALPAMMKSRQLSLFQNFLCNTPEERQRLSNSIELWDSVPRYSISRGEMEKRRNESGYLPLLTLAFEYRKNQYTATIQPTLVEEKAANGRLITTAYYPSANEELVEEVLRKFAADQNKGFHDPEMKTSGVVFSVYQIREELKRRRHTRSYYEIVLSLKILSGSVIDLVRTVEEKPKSVVKSTILPFLGSVTRDDLNHDHNAKWTAHFHPMVTDCIANLSYRQFNYDQLMKHKKPLSRWIHRQLIAKYTAASRTTPFIMYYKTIHRDSAMLRNYSRDRTALNECDTAFEELKTNGVLSKVEKSLQLGERGKIKDIIYTLTPGQDFVSEVIAANKRGKR